MPSPSSPSTTNGGGSVEFLSVAGLSLFSAASGRRSSRLDQVALVLEKETLPRCTFNLPQGACSRHIKKPRINTVWVELVVTRQNPHILTFLEVLCTDRTSHISDWASASVSSAMGFSYRSRFFGLATARGRRSCFRPCILRKD